MSATHNRSGAPPEVPLHQVRCRPSLRVPFRGAEPLPPVHRRHRQSRHPHRGPSGGGPGPAAPPTPEALHTPRGWPREPPGSPADRLRSASGQAQAGRLNQASNPLGETLRASGSNSKLGSIPSHKPESPFVAGRAKQAAAPFGMSRSSAAGGSSAEAPEAPAVLHGSNRPTVAPLPGLPPEPSFGSPDTVGSNSLDSDSGLRPPRTSSTIRGRNSSEYRGLLLLFIGVSSQRVKCPRNRGESNLRNALQPGELPNGGEALLFISDSTFTHQSVNFILTILRDRYRPGPNRFARNREFPPCAKIRIPQPQNWCVPRHAQPLIDVSGLRSTWVWRSP